jgi:hypothetical protein
MKFKPNDQIRYVGPNLRDGKKRTVISCNERYLTYDHDGLVWLGLVDRFELVPPAPDMKFKPNDQIRYVNPKFQDDQERTVVRCNENIVTYKYRDLEWDQPISEMELVPPAHTTKFKPNDQIRYINPKYQDTQERTVVKCDENIVTYKYRDVECSQPISEMELVPPAHTTKFKPGDVVRPKAEFADKYVIKTGWVIDEVEGGYVKYHCISNSWTVTDRCPIDHIELQPPAPVTTYKPSEAVLYVDGQRIELKGTSDPVFSFDFKTVKKSEGTWDTQGRVYCTPTPQPTEWTFKGDLDYRRLRDDLIEAEADWAIVDDVVYIRGRIKHAMDVLGIKGATKVCRGLWESEIYPPIARDGRFDEMLKEVANRPVHRVEVFKCR